MQASPAALDSLAKLAKLGVDYVEERAHQAIRAMTAEGQSPPAPLSGPEKQAEAVRAMRSLAPPGLTFTDEQARVAVDSAVHRQRMASSPSASLRPSAPQDTE